MAKTPNAPTPEPGKPPDSPVPGPQGPRTPYPVNDPPLPPGGGEPDYLPPPTVPGKM